VSTASVINIVVAITKDRCRYYPKIDDTGKELFQNSGKKYIKFIKFCYFHPFYFLFYDSLIHGVFMNKKSIVIAFSFALTLQCLGPSGDLDFGGCTIKLQGYVYSKATKAPLDSVLVTLDSIEGTNLEQRYTKDSQFSESDGSFGMLKPMGSIGYELKINHGSYDTINLVHSASATFSKLGYVDTSFRIGKSSCDTIFNVYMREK
jgi:hypothetical protein